MQVAKVGLGVTSLPKKSGPLIQDLGDLVEYKKSTVQDVANQKIPMEELPKGFNRVVDKPDEKRDRDQRRRQSTGSRQTRPGTSQNVALIQGVVGVRGMSGS